MQSFERVNSSDLSDSGEPEDVSDTGVLVKGMNTKRKRAVNLLVRSVGAPIQKGYVVSFI